MAKLVGANRDFILNRIPHISRLMVDNIEAVLHHAEIIVIGNKTAEFDGVPQRMRTGQYLVDFARIVKDGSRDGYEGICW